GRHSHRDLDVESIPDGRCRLSGERGSPHCGTLGRPSLAERPEDCSHTGVGDIPTSPASSSPKPPPWLTVGGSYDSVSLSRHFSPTPIALDTRFVPDG